jgi:hypothetical protein
LLSIAITSLATAGGGDGDRSAGIRAIHEAKQRNPTDVEIRFEFYPGWTPNMDDSTAPFFIAVGRDGRARALRYELRYQTKPVATYEGMLPEPEVQRLFARISAAFRLPKHRKDYDRHKVYEGDGFYLAIKSNSGKVKEMSGGDGPRPDEVRELIRDMRELWKQLMEVPSAYAYITSRPVENDRLRRLKGQRPSRLTPIESLPATLQSLLIPVVTQPLNFYPLTQEQYDQIQSYKRPMTYNGAGYELTLILAAKEIEAQKIKVNQLEDPLQSARNRRYEIG